MKLYLCKTLMFIGLCFLSACSSSHREVEEAFIKNYRPRFDDRYLGVIINDDPLIVKSVKAEKTDRSGIWRISYQTQSIHFSYNGKPINDCHCIVSVSKGKDGRIVLHDVNGF